MSNNITDDRAARRFHQLAMLERQLAIKSNDLVLSKAHSRELREEIDGLIQRIRAAARDEGELPLFDLDGND